MVAVKISGDHHYHDHKASRSSGHVSVLSLSNLLSVLGITIVSYAIGFSMSVLLLRYLSIEQYGDMMLAKQILLVVSVVLSMGTKNVSKRFLIHYLNDQSPYYKDFIWWHLAYLLRYILMFSVIYSSSLLLFSVLDSYDYIHLGHFHLGYWSLVSAPFVTIASILTVYLLSFGYVVLYEFIVSILGNLLWVILLGVWMFMMPVPDSWDLVMFVVVQALLQFFVLGLCAFILLREPIRETLAQSGELFLDGRWHSHRFSSLMIDLYSSLPVMIFLTTVEIFYPGEHLVGHLSLVLSITILFYLIPSAIYPLIYSHLDHLVRRPQDRAKDMPLLVRANRLVMILDLVLLVVMIFFGQDILRLFGESSVRAYHLLVFFSLVSLIGGLYYPMLNFSLIALGQSRFIGTVDILFYLVLLILGPCVAIYFGGVYCAYLFGGMIVFQFIVSNIQFMRQAGFLVFSLW